MLIDKGVSAGEVVSFKLTSGEELIAKLVEETATGYKVSKPLVLSMSQQGIGMIPFMFTVNPEKDISISKNSVIAISSCDKQFADQYISGTTGIAMR
jgi:hypothetical protein